MLIKYKKVAEFAWIPRMCTSLYISIPHTNGPFKSAEALYYYLVILKTSKLCKDV